jgi:hypothetical protein
LLEKARNFHLKWKFLGKSQERYLAGKGLYAPKGVEMALEIKGSMTGG